MSRSPRIDALSCVVLSYSMGGGTEGVRHEATTDEQRSLASWLDDWAAGTWLDTKARMRMRMWMWMVNDMVEMDLRI